MSPILHLLLGVTGGIATGKTTVANMLEELGAPIIDFDVLARRVVEPDKPAWKDIVAYFGEEILLEDRTIDRKKLSGIVFNDAEKRRKLEGFIHPRAGDEYAEEVGRITTADPNAIIQAVIPLLFEAKMQDMFEKTLLVYTNRETQIERLVPRDGISEEEAARILDAQLPIDEKVGLADFVIKRAWTRHANR
jgi:dephospho-CoA kinase